MASLPYDVIGHIIDILAAERDPTPLKNTSLVSSSVLHLCRGHIFRTIPFDNYNFHSKLESLRPKQSFINLVINNPSIVQYIRELNYEVHQDDARLSPLFPNLLQTIPHLECLRIRGAPFNPGGNFDWTQMDPLLQSALLRLMYLPTLTQFSITKVRNIPISALALCFNLQRLDIRCITVTPFEESDLDLLPDIGSLKTPRILHFTNDSSPTAVGRLLTAKWKDGRPVLDFTHLKTLAVDFDTLHPEIAGRDLFKSLEELEKLSITVPAAPIYGPSFSGLAEMVSLSAARNLKTLEFTGPLPIELMLVGLYEELETLMGHDNVLQVLNFRIIVNGCESKTLLMTTFRQLEQVLMNTGWSALKRIFIQVTIGCCSRRADGLMLKSLPELYLIRLSSRGILVYESPV